MSYFPKVHKLSDLEKVLTDPLYKKVLVSAVLSGEEYGSIEDLIPKIIEQSGGLWTLVVNELRDSGMQAYAVNVQDKYRVLVYFEIKDPEKVADVSYMNLKHWLTNLARCMNSDVGLNVYYHNGPDKYYIALGFDIPDRYEEVINYVELLKSGYDMLEKNFV